MESSRVSLLCSQRHKEYVKMLKERQEALGEKNEWVQLQQFRPLLRLLLLSDNPNCRGGRRRPGGRYNQHHWVRAVRPPKPHRHRHDHQRPGSDKFPPAWISTQSGLPENAAAVVVNSDRRITAAVLRRFFTSERMKGTARRSREPRPTPARRKWRRCLEKPGNRSPTKSKPRRPSLPLGPAAFPPALLSSRCCCCAQDPLAHGLPQRLH